MTFGVKHSRRKTVQAETANGKTITVKYPHGELTREDIKVFEQMVRRIAKSMRIDCKELER